MYREPYFNFGLHNDQYDQTVLENQIYENIRPKIKANFRGDLEQNKNKEVMLRKIINQYTSQYVV